MSKYSIRHLNLNVITGYAQEKIKAWHQARYDLAELIAKGQAYDGPVPLGEARRILGYSPEYRKVYVEGDDGFPELIEDRTAIVLPKDPELETFSSRIAYVGSDGYRIHDPHTTLVTNVEALTEHGVHLASVGKLGGGRLAFTSWRPAEGRVEIPGLGSAQPYINAATSTDGSLATTVHVSTTLQVCDNTAASSLWSAGLRVYRLRHTVNGVFDTDEARRVIDLAVKSTAQTSAMLTQLGDVAITESDLDLLINKLTEPAKDASDRSRTMAMNKRHEMKHMSHYDPRVTPVGGTLLGAWQLVNTWGTWGTSIRGNADPVSKQFTRVAAGRPVDIDTQFWGIVKDMGLMPETLAKELAKVGA